MYGVADLVVFLRAAIAPRCGQAVWVKGEKGIKTGWPPSSLCCETGLGLVSAVSDEDFLTDTR